MKRIWLLLLAVAVWLVLSAGVWVWFEPTFGMPSFNGMSKEQITTWTYENIPQSGNNELSQSGNVICTKPAMYLETGANCGGRQHFMFYAFKSAGYSPVRFNNSEHSIIYSEGCWYDGSFGNWSCDAELMKDYGPYPPFVRLGGFKCVDVSHN